MALLKHPLALLRRRPEEMRAAALSLERGAFRDVYLGGAWTARGRHSKPRGASASAATSR